MAGGGEASTSAALRGYGLAFGAPMSPNRVMVITGHRAYLRTTGERQAGYGPAGGWASVRAGGGGGGQPRGGPPAPGKCSSPCGYFVLVGLFAGCVLVWCGV